MPWLQAGPKPPKRVNPFYSGANGYKSHSSACDPLDSGRHKSIARGPMRPATSGPAPAGASTSHGRASGSRTGGQGGLRLALHWPCNGARAAGGSGGGRLGYSPGKGGLRLALQRGKGGDSKTWESFLHRTHPPCRPRTQRRFHVCLLIGLMIRLTLQRSKGVASAPFRARAESEQSSMPFAATAAVRFKTRRTIET